jgi:hypothetical protein
VTSPLRPSRSLLTAARQGHTCAVVIMVVCGVLVLAGLGAIARWGSLAIAVPAAEEGHGRVVTALRSYLWWAGLAIGDGLLTAAVRSWYSRRLPLPAWHGPGRWHYLALVALLLLVFVVGVPVLALVAVGAVPVAVIARTAPGVATWWTSPRTTTVGRGLLAGGSLLALTGFVTTVGDIVS